MKLDVARLCLDCEEVYDAQQCPTCGSEAFAFLTRWVQPSREPEHHRPSPEVTPRAELYRRLLTGQTRRPRAGRLLAQGALGLAAVGLAGLIWRVTRSRQSDRQRTPSAGADE